MQINHVSFVNIPDIPESITKEYMYKEQKTRYVIGHIVIPFSLLGIDIAVFIYIWNSYNVISCIVAGMLFAMIAFILIFSREKIGGFISKKYMRNWIVKNHIKNSAETLRNMYFYNKWMRRKTNTYPAASPLFILEGKKLTVCDTDIQGRRFTYNFFVRRIRGSFTQEYTSFDLANSILTLPCDRFGRLTGGIVNEER